MSEMTPTGVSRRNLLGAAAWSAPVIATAIAVPLASASTAQPTICSGPAGSYSVAADAVVVTFARVPDIYEANVRSASGSTRGYGTNYGSAPKRGSLVWVIPLASLPEWVQVHPFNEHYGESKCRPAGGTRVSA